jgi:hypothetical protein
MKCRRYAPFPKRKSAHILGALVVSGVCWAVAGCLAILPPIFAEQVTEPAWIEDSPAATAAVDERGPLLSLAAILLGVTLWGCWRVFQQSGARHSPERAWELRQQALAQIAGLDADYAHGRIRAHRYHRKRDQLKQRAVALTIRANQGQQSHDGKM